MPNLFGRSYTRAELLQRVGDISQIGGVRRVRLQEGTEDGVDAIEFRTGSGLGFTVLPGRGMDISGTDFCGMSLCWRSATGDASSAFFEPEGLGWLRTFYGGLVVTCGLTYCGAPCEDGDDELGLHGRVSHIPARGVHADGAWDGDEYWMWAQGKMREASVFGPNLLLTRKICARLGESTIRIQDVVANEGHEPQEHMFLYHCNLGFPLLDAGAEFLAPSKQVTPRTEFSGETLPEHAKFAPPTAGIEERVYYHDLATDAHGMTCVALVNRDFPGGHALGLSLKFSKNELTQFAQWKMPAQGTYVMGLE
ncbi:MAG: aldose 1-epimerase family protein, partial [Armatimonadota bacterium]